MEAVGSGNAVDFPLLCCHVCVVRQIFSAMREVRRHPQLVSKSLIKDFFEATVKAARGTSVFLVGAGACWSVVAFLWCSWVVFWCC